LKVLNLTIWERAILWGFVPARVDLLDEIVDCIAVRDNLAFDEKEVEELKIFHVMVDRKKEKVFEEKWSRENFSSGKTIILDTVWDKAKENVGIDIPFENSGFKLLKRYWDKPLEGVKYPSDTRTLELREKLENPKEIETKKAETDKS